MEREDAERESKRGIREMEERKRHNAALQEWNQRLEELRVGEKQMLEAQSLPLRLYLMKYVMPTLSKGLIEVCRVRPDDPLDFLVSFCFFLTKEEDLNANQLDYRQNTSLNRMQLIVWQLQVLLPD